jgi:hypothetical protein
VRRNSTYDEFTWDWTPPTLQREPALALPVSS